MSVVRFLKFAILPLSILGFATPAIASKSDAQPKQFADFIACRAVAEPTARLDCFDRTSARFQDATDTKEIVILDREEVRKTKRSLFGFNLPKLPFFSGKDGDDQPEFTEIKTTIERANGVGYGKWAIKTAEGATWQTTEVMNRSPASGQAVTIKQGTMGGYFLKVDKGRPVRAKRTD